MRVRDLLLGFGVGCFGLGLLVWPEEVMAAGREALALCANTIVPSLFPFFVLSSLVIGLGYAQGLGRLLGRVMTPLFGLNGNCASALVLGLVGGYPVGAKTAAELYRQGLCSRQEGERMLGFCSNAGPAFLVGVVGIGVFGSTKFGLLLWGVHILCALLVGLLLRFQGGNIATQSACTSTSIPRSPARVFSDSVKDSLTTLLQVCAFILLFGVLLRLGRCTGLLSPGSLWLERLLCGFVEVSNGVAMLPADEAAKALPMAAFLLGWGGLSVLCQTVSVVQESGLSIRTYIYGKLLHGLFSAGLISILIRFIPEITEAFAASANPLNQDYVYHPVYTLLCAAALALVFWRIGKNRAGNRRKQKV